MYSDFSRPIFVPQRYPNLRANFQKAYWFLIATGTTTDKDGWQGNVFIKDYDESGDPQPLRSDRLPFPSVAPFSVFSTDVTPPFRVVAAGDEYSICSVFRAVFTCQYIYVNGSRRGND
jgi:hypothetical protein